eukprot:TRINITY_DN8538_c0_g1_i1.p1 TRINITY_DN8538_c0_g1~~TRINITY_DN8538_c0_g1_i1.p1  ORF type:complete len:357 (-),score=50.29 TRINITY_DN8538_c0_g1_i1:196-1266(-)
MDVEMLVDCLKVTEARKGLCHARILKWLSDGNVGSLSELAAVGLVPRFIEELDLHAAQEARARIFFESFVQGRVAEIPVAPGAPTDLASSAFKQAYKDAKYDSPQTPNELINDVITIVDAFSKHHQLSPSDAALMSQQLIGEWNPNDNVAKAAEKGWTSQKGFPGRGTEFCSIYSDAMRNGYAVKAAARFARCLKENLVKRSGSYAWPEGPAAQSPDNVSSEADVTWRGGGFHDVQEVRDFFIAGKEYRVAQPLATSYKKSVAECFIRRARGAGSTAFVLWKIKFDSRERCKHVNLIKDSHVQGEWEFLTMPFSAFKVISVQWQANPDENSPHQIEIYAFPDNKTVAEDLPLAPWC